MITPVDCPRTELQIFILLFAEHESDAESSIGNFEEVEDS